MRIGPGRDEDDREIELGKTEARQASPGYNMYVLILALAGAVIAFILIFSQ
jgi:hypothetical protein